MKEIKIKDKIIGPGHPCFMIAEMSCNHNSDIERAYKIIEAAAEAGADAIKIQTHTPESLTIDSPQKWFKIDVYREWGVKTLYELYQKAHTPWSWHQKLKEYAESKGLIFFATPFGRTAVRFLEKMDIPLYKVASFETGDLELLKEIGRTKKPVIISRGLTEEEDIKLAIETLQQAGSPQVAVLHCVSSYPATIDQMNVSTVSHIIKHFQVISGLSDHSLGITAAITAIPLGASIIEKHFTLGREDGGFDASFSLEPKEFKELVQTVRGVEKALGNPTYKIGPKEKENLVYRRSLFVVKDIKAGEKFTRENVRSIRPGQGLSPKHLPEVLGKVARVDIRRGTPLSQDLIES